MFERPQVVRHARHDLLFGQPLGPREQRYLGHLRQVHPHRVIAQLRQLAGRNGGDHSAVDLDRFIGRRGAADFRPVGGRLVDQFDAHFVQCDQQTIELLRIDRFVGQVVIHLIVGQISLGLAFGDQFVQILV